ncbi:MAG: thiamine phosphate synthase, partial [Planctomycetota bacterium]
MHEARRLIDANSNRATEAARTLEDLARFSLDDGSLAARFKGIRHGLESALASAGLTRDVRAMARDTANDAGIANSASDAHERATERDIACAAGSRLGEALRVIEETLKLATPEAAAEVEQLRYTGYDAERALLTRLARHADQWPVCVLVTEALCAQHSWQDVVRGAIAGGAACIQLREKSLTDRELLARARELVATARPAGVAVMVNDRADIAALADADGVHLGQGDLSVADARRIVGERLLIGVSCSSVDDARAAIEEGADTIGVGAMFETATKAKPSIGGPELLAAVLADASASRVLHLPHLAIGGITAERAGQLAAIGCRGVAV